MYRMMTAEERSCYAAADGDHCRVGMAQVAKRYSLFQRSVRLAQTSVRRLDWWLLNRMPGLPNPPEVEAKLRQPRFVDLWEFTLADHAHNLKLAWRDYRESFEEPSDVDLERSKEEVKAVVGRLRGDVESNASKNLDFLNEQIEGTQLQANLKEMQRTSSENVAYLRNELKHATDKVDVDAVVAHARSAIEENRSKDDVATTLKKNVAEIADLVKEGRDAALAMDKQDVDRVKTDMQSWLADKLMVGQDVLLAFIKGYREGKQLELEREDALLITFAKQAAEEQKEVVKEHFDRFVASQREKQRQQQEAQQHADQTEIVEASKDTTSNESTSEAASRDASRPIDEDKKISGIQSSQS